MKLKLISDGTINGTRVVNSETNEILDDVFSIHYMAKANCIPYLVMKIWLPKVNIDINTNDYEIFMTSNYKSWKETHKFVPIKNLEKL